MSRFPSSAHLCSWAGLALRNNESAGGRKRGKTATKGNEILKTVLTQCAKAVAKNKDSYFSAQHHFYLQDGAKIVQLPPWLTRC